MEVYRAPSIIQLYASIFDLNSSGTAQLYSHPSLRPAGRLMPASVVGLGPGYAYDLGDGIYDRLRYDPGHRTHPEPHVNAEVIQKKKSAAERTIGEILSDVHIAIALQK